MIISLQRYDHVFESGLERQRPENAGDGAEYQLFTGRSPVGQDGLEGVEGGGPYISVDDA